MRVLACGGRDFADRKFLEEVLDDLNARRGPFEVLIHGGARGADTLAGLWAKRRGTASTSPWRWRQSSMTGWRSCSQRPGWTWR